jgi:hypothetical protein
MHELSLDLKIPSRIVEKAHTYQLKYHMQANIAEQWNSS